MPHFDSNIPFDQLKAEDLLPPRAAASKPKPQKTESAGTVKREGKGLRILPKISIRNYQPSFECEISANRMLYERLGMVGPQQT